MNRSLPLVSLATAALGLAACSRVPVTNRAQLNLIPDKIMQDLGKTAYTDTISDASVLKTGDESTVLKRVGQRISKATDETDYQWRYSMLEDDDTINAWCMPGGKIAFYTGILPVLKNESGMAFVMGHEVGHATAHHGAERMSQQLAVLGGVAGLSLYIDGKSGLSNDQKNIIIAALGAGAEVGVLLPFSRKQEREADIIGLMYMSKAGYPPSESTKLWDRMEAQTGGSGVPAFLSTHPSNEKRKETLNDWMGQANKRYQRNKLSGDLTDTLWTTSSSSSKKGSSSSSSSSSSSGSSKNETSSGSSKSGSSSSDSKKGTTQGGNRE